MPSGSHRYQFFALFHPEWYESLDYYQPGDSLLRVIRTVPGLSWRLVRRGPWFSVSPPDFAFPRQGWKIHISGTPDNCEEVLRRVGTICKRNNTAFKFYLDRFFISLLTSKLLSRAASGKFITIYPPDEQCFRALIEELYQALKGFEGPYVLSDRRYKDSRLVYYRYGGISSLEVLDVSGVPMAMLQAPDGSLVPDERTPYWNPPSWAIDPFEPPQETSERAEASLKEGRYVIEQALHFSDAGGIYQANDRQSGNTVVIKEARPTVGIDKHGQDAIARLQKEYRLLQKLQKTGITPLPVDLFWDWEHLFLVEEYIPGPHLGMFTISRNPLFRFQATEEMRFSHREKLKEIWKNLALGTAVMHDHGIIYGDFSLKNVIVSDVESGKIRIIDLESAWEEGVDYPDRMVTPGFVHTTEQPGRADDYYALGAIMLGTLFPINSFLDVEPSARYVFIETIGDALGVSTPVRQLITQCMSESASQRPTPLQVFERIQQEPFHAEPAIPPGVARRLSRESQKSLHATLDGIADYLHFCADTRRNDRLFPADPLVFLTNPLSLAHGAAGVAYALFQLQGQVPETIRAWILKQSITHEKYPPGLYMGTAGIAWTLWEIGLEDVALSTMSSIDGHPLLWDSADILYGAAGYGLACLRFFQDTKESAWLERAVQVGEWLLNSKKMRGDQAGCYWSDKQGRTQPGYAHGASGIALYLLYLSQASGEKRFLETGKQAMAFDLSLLLPQEGGYLSTPRGFVGDPENVVSPYWLQGSAGIATSLLRYWANTREASYLDTLNLLVPDTFHNYTIFPGLFQGLAGLGNFLLDAYDFTGEQRYLDEAHEAAHSVLLYKAQRPQGIAFPGEQLLRLSADFGTGSAGIALFLKRLAHAEQHPGNFNFTLDQLLPRGSTEAVSENLAISRQ